MFNCECGAELIQEDCETILDVCQEAPVVKDYETLANKPQINGVTLDGNKTSEDLGITQEIADAVSAEATLRENADTALGGRIDNEATARENADTALGGRIDGEITNRTNADAALGTRIDNEILARQGGDNNLQTQIDAITSKSDVVDVVANYAALQAYDTSSLGNNDVIKVLDDETHEDAQTYYRWNKTAGTWSYIGSEAPYYSKGQMDTMLQAKQDKLIAGTNIQIAQDGKTISATDTTYTAGNGLNLNGTEFSADTTVLATKSDLDSYYTKTETDTKLAPKLEAEVVAELPSTGTEGKLYLTPKNYTTGTATGNPITISLGEDAGQITGFKLDGDTYQQSYAGKNDFAVANISSTDNEIVETVNADGSITVKGTATANRNLNNYIYDLSLIENGATYTFWYDGDTLPTGAEFRAGLYDGTTWVRHLIGSNKVLTSTTKTQNGTANTAGADRLRCQLYIPAGTTINGTFRVQLEKSATATDFEKFVGGTPSPNPDYPQPIQTVTGEQTISINGTNYPISLGSIELCKLGTYQDYIYKDGDDWKVHKATAKTTVSAIGSWQSNVASGGKYRYFSNNMTNYVTPASSSILGVGFSDNYVIATGATNYLPTQSFALTTASGNKRIYIYDNNYGGSDNVAGFLAARGDTKLYLALVTATDTVITDTALITQLEAIRTASLQASNTITNTATGTNLAGDIELGYYEFDPTNRYDKWLWLDLNNNYEKLGS